MVFTDGVFGSSLAGKQGTLPFRLFGVHVSFRSWPFFVLMLFHPMLTLYEEVLVTFHVSIGNRYDPEQRGLLLGGRRLPDEIGRAHV